MIILNVWKNKNVPNHQPVMFGFVLQLCPSSYLSVYLPIYLSLPVSVYSIMYDYRLPANQKNDTACYFLYFDMWGFPKMGIPPNGWFIRENPKKIEDIEGTLFQETFKVRPFDMP